MPRRLETDARDWGVTVAGLPGDTNARAVCRLTESRRADVAAVRRFRIMAVQKVGLGCFIVHESKIQCGVNYGNVVKKVKRSNYCVEYIICLQ
jgi:hypothetical protein